MTKYSAPNWRPVLTSSRREPGIRPLPTVLKAGRHFIIRGPGRQDIHTPWLEISRIQDHRIPELYKSRRDHSPGCSPDSVKSSLRSFCLVRKMSLYSPIITVAVVASLVTGVKALWELSQLALPKSRPTAVEHNASKYRSGKPRRKA